MGGPWLTQDFSPRCCSAFFTERLVQLVRAHPTPRVHCDTLVRSPAVSRGPSCCEKTKRRSSGQPARGCRSFLPPSQPTFCALERMHACPRRERLSSWRLSASCPSVLIRRSALLQPSLLRMCILSDLLKPDLSNVARSELQSLYVQAPYVGTRLAMKTRAIEKVEPFLSRRELLACRSPKVQIDGPLFFAPRGDKSARALQIASRSGTPARHLLKSRSVQCSRLHRRPGEE